MKFKRSLSAILSAAILVVFTKYAFAENREGAVSITPGVGAYFMDGKRDVKNQALLNLGLDYDFTNHWGVEALAGRVNTKNKAISEQKVKGGLYLLDGVYHFNTQSPFEPYVLAGIGLLDLDPNGKVTFSTPHGDQAKLQMNINGGAGIEYFVHPNIALRSDVRDIYTPAGGKNDYLINFGISILMGAHPQAVTALPVSVLSDPINPCIGTKVIVRFANNSPVIDALYKTQLQEVASCMQKNHRLKAVVRGYASSTGTVRHNLKLSQQRANNVKKYLLEHDALHENNIRSQGFGEANPVASNATLAGQAQNRRAETVVVSVFENGRK